jgi:hypothetical protein
MFRSATPIAFFQQQTQILRSHLPGVLDGRRDTIHDARIATRRIREVLPLTYEWQRRQAVDGLFKPTTISSRECSETDHAEL